MLSRKSLLLVGLLFCVVSLAKTGPEPTQIKKKIKPIDFQTTLRFDPYANGVTQPSILLDYEITDDHIKIGNTVLSEQSFKIFIGTPTAIDPKLSAISELGNDEIFLISIASALFKKGSLEIISENGESVWEHNYSTSEILLGQKIKPQLPANLTNNQSEMTILTNVIAPNEITVLSGEKKGSFKFCLKQELNEYFSKICSPPYRYTQQTKKLKIQGETTAIRAYLNSKEAVVKDSVPMTTNQTVHFFASSGNQYSLEFKSHPQPLYLVDFFRESNSNNIILTGHTFPPTHPNCKILNEVDESALLYKIGWIPTIGDLKTYWTLTLPPDSNAIYLMGEAGGQFTYNLKFDKVPFDNQKIKLDQNSLDSTYLPVLKIPINAPAKSKVSSKQKSAKLINANKNRFVWNFEADQLGVEQTKTLLLSTEQDNWLANHTIYRGYSSEFSFRLAGILSQSLQLNTLAELAYNHWFERIFNLDSRALSVQRWGISLKSFKPLKTFKLKNSTESAVSLILTTLDLKYRLTPGLWERDETWGLILGYEDVNINSLKAPLLGGGFFWARSMPKLFDELMNYLPFMSYSKWVDMDFMYYKVPLKGNLTAGSNFAINFHGKVLWSRAIFGEAGFGYKSYEYKDLTIKKYTSLQSFYGTIGIGLNF